MSDNLLAAGGRSQRWFSRVVRELPDPHAGWNG
jgi:hypothetical protein